MLPPATRRLFQDFDLDDPADSSARQLVILRLLEEGEGGDLRWLAQSVGEAEIAACFRQRASRQLSRRSGQFWGLVLGTAAPRIDASREALWPL